MKHVHIESKSIMTLHEAGDIVERVGVVLDTSNDEGILWYLGEESMRRVDWVNVVFNGDGKDGITLWISLLAGETFEKPYVTAKSGNDLKCINDETHKGKTILELIFVDPGPDNLILEDLLFHTSLGVIDPSVSIGRGTST